MIPLHRGVECCHERCDCVQHLSHIRQFRQPRELPPLRGPAAHCLLILVTRGRKGVRPRRRLQRPTGKWHPTTPAVTRAA